MHFEQETCPDAVDKCNNKQNKKKINKKDKDYYRKIYFIDQFWHGVGFIQKKNILQALRRHLYQVK